MVVSDIQRPALHSRLFDGHGFKLPRPAWIAAAGRGFALLVLVMPLHQLVVPARRFMLRVVVVHRHRGDKSWVVGIKSFSELFAIIEYSLSNFQVRQFPDVALISSFFLIFHNVIVLSHYRRWMLKTFNDSGDALHVIGYRFALIRPILGPFRHYSPCVTLSSFHLTKCAPISAQCIAPDAAFKAAQWNVFRAYKGAESETQYSSGTHQKSEPLSHTLLLWISGDPNGCSRRVRSWW